MKKLLSVILSIIMIFGAFAVPASAYAASVGQVKSVKVVSKGTYSVKLKWKKVKGATGYQIYYSTKKSKGFKKGKTIKKGATTSGSVIGLKDNKKYFFKVRAVKKKKNGKYSKVVSAKTKKAKRGATTTKAVLVEDEKVYTQYDITGDGKADKLKIINRGNYEQTEAERYSHGGAYLIVYINDKKVQEIEGGRAISTYLMAPTYNSSYLIFRCHYLGTGWDDVIYTYKNGKYVKIYEIKNPYTYVDNYAVTPSGFSNISYVGRYDRGIFGSYDTKPMKLKINYSFKNRNIVLNSNIATAATSYNYEAQMDFSAYSSPSLSYSDIDVYEGDTVRITQKNLSNDWYTARVTREYGGESFICYFKEDLTDADFGYENPLLY